MIQKFISSFNNVIDYNTSSFTGSMDIIVIKDSEGNLKSTPFHLKFGKFKVLNYKNKKIEVYINGEKTGITMKINKNGNCYFKEYIEGEYDNNELSDDILSSDNEYLPTDNKLFEKLPKSEDKDTTIMNKKKVKTQSNEDEIEEDSQILLSLSGNKINGDMDDEQILKQFNKYIINFEEFKEDPYKFITNKDLLIKVHDNIFNSIIGVPYIISLLAFNKDLDSESVGKLEKLKHFDIFKKGKISKNLVDSVKKKQKKKYVKTISPSSDILKKLNLKPLKNVIEFKVIGNLSEVKSIKNEIYLYNKNAKFIVSDVDGTVTKSDVLGFFLPMFGKDWTQDNISLLFKKIVKNNYHIIYLSARNMGFTGITRDYLKKISQDGLEMPEGPIITAPENYFKTITREVILKAPDLFKCAALRNIQKVAGDDCLFSGFGNKDTDAIAYRTVGVEKARIYTINPIGEIHIFGSKVLTSYKELSNRVDEIFPKINEDNHVNTTFYKNNYWSTKLDYNVEETLKDYK